MTLAKFQINAVAWVQQLFKNHAPLMAHPRVTLDLPLLFSILCSASATASSFHAARVLSVERVRMKRLARVGTALA